MTRTTGRWRRRISTTTDARATRRTPRAAGRRRAPSLPLHALVFAGAFAGAAPAPAAPTLPGVGPEDRRTEVDARAAPWSSLVRINVVFGPGRSGLCTGGLIGPRLAITAAHCLHGPRGPAPPSSIHLVFGYDRGEWRDHMTAERVALGEGYGSGRMRGDVALITLPRATKTAEPLPVSETAVAAGVPLALGDFGQDRAHVIVADEGCRAVGRPASFFHPPRLRRTERHERRAPPRVGGRRVEGRRRQRRDHGEGEPRGRGGRLSAPAGRGPGRRRAPALTAWARLAWRVALRRPGRGPGEPRPACAGLGGRLMRAWRPGWVARSRFDGHMTNGASSAGTSAATGGSSPSSGGAR